MFEILVSLRILARIFRWLVGIWWSRWACDSFLQEKRLNSPTSDDLNLSRLDVEFQQHFQNLILPLRYFRIREHFSGIDY